MDLDRFDLHEEELGASGTVEDNPNEQWHRVLDVSAHEGAGAIVYLASPAAGSTTGTALQVDGGMAGLRLRTEEPRT
jgi:hypothetical protein